MGFNLQSRGHNFAFGDDVCTKCGMTRPYYEDNGKPRCAGKRPDKQERMTVPDDD